MIHEKIQDCIKVIDKAPVTIQQKLLMISSVEVAKANYAPLVEQVQDKARSKERYDLIDIDIANQIKKLLNLQHSTKDMLKFVTDSREFGGLEIMLPGVYYENLTQAQEAFLTGTNYDVFRQVKKERMRLICESMRAEEIESAKQQPKVAYPMLGASNYPDSVMYYLS